MPFVKLLTKKSILIRILELRISNKHFIWALFLKSSKKIKNIKNYWDTHLGNEYHLLRRSDTHFTNAVSFFEFFLFFSQFFFYFFTWYSFLKCVLVIPSFKYVVGWYFWPKFSKIIFVSPNFFKKHYTIYGLLQGLKSVVLDTKYVTI